MWHGWGALHFKGPDTWTSFIILLISQVTWTSILLASVWDKPNPFRVNPANLGFPPCLGVREASRHGRRRELGTSGLPLSQVPCGSCWDACHSPLGWPPPHPSSSRAPIRVSAFPRGFCSYRLLFNHSASSCSSHPVLKVEEKQFSLYSFEFLAEVPVKKGQIQKRKKKKEREREVYEYTCT